MTRRVRRRVDGYMLHVFTDDGMSRTTGGDYPTRDLAETVGEALRRVGAVTGYSVEPCNHEGYWIP